MPVDTVHPDYAEFKEKWERCRDALEGDEAVKEKGVDYLPQPAGQDDDEYEAYKTRALFYNATGRTLDAMVGMVFRKTPEIAIADSILPFLDDINLSRVPFLTFAQQVFSEILSVGRAGVLVDMQDENASATNRRAYFVRYRTEQIINWRSEFIDSRESLTLVVLHEVVSEADSSDPYVLISYDQYRVLSLESPITGGASTYWMRIYRVMTADNKSSTQLVSGVQPKLKGRPLEFIPFVMITPMGLSLEIVKPPLLDLVDLNLSHYRSSADLESGRFYTGHPQPWLAGFPDSEEYVIGGATVWVTSDPTAKAGMLEFTGTGLGALENALVSKEKMMASLGARLLEEQKRASEAAETVKLRQAGEQSILQRLAKSVSGGLTQALTWLSLWMGAGDKASANLNSDYIDTSIDSAMLRELVGLYQSGGMSFETLYQNLIRGEIAREGVSAEQERAAIEADAARGTV
jgi:Domain of unknown function (DUF4055)